MSNTTGKYSLPGVTLIQHFMELDSSREEAKVAKESRQALLLAELEAIRRSNREARLLAELEEIRWGKREARLLAELEEIRKRNETAESIRENTFYLLENLCTCGGSCCRNGGTAILSAVTAKDRFGFSYEAFYKIAEDNADPMIKATRTERPSCGFTRNHMGPSDNSVSCRVCGTGDYRAV